MPVITSSIRKLSVIKDSKICVAFIGVVLVLSGLVVSALEFCMYLCVRPLSKKIYQIIIAYIAEYYWIEFVWLLESWAEVDIHIFAEPGLTEAMPFERAISVINHRSDIDWMILWAVAARLNFLGYAKCILKAELGKLPILSWTWKFSDFIFLRRNWDSDQRTLKSCFKQFDGYSTPYWIAIFCEGTRFTEEKHEVSKKFCVSNNIVPFKNLLCPRLKAWELCIEEMRSLKAVDYVYQLTLAFPDGVPELKEILFPKKRRQVHVNITRTSLKDIPLDSDGSSKWLMDSYRKMDDLLENMKNTGRLSSYPEDLTPKRGVTFVVTYTWAALVLLFFWVAGSTIYAIWKLFPCLCNVRIFWCRLRVNAHCVVDGAEE